MVNMPEDILTNTLGANDGARTHDLYLTKDVRYLLRHISILSFVLFLSDF